MGKPYTKQELPYAQYDDRTSRRERTLMKATIDMVAYFMGLGDDQATAESKVSQVSTQVAALLYVYTLGNTQPLIDAINAIDEGVFPYMDTTAKGTLIGFLTTAS